MHNAECSNHHKLAVPMFYKQSENSVKSALIVYAHQEPKSFNAALRDTAAETLKSQGYDVEISDLYALDFDPRATKNDFTGQLQNPERLVYFVEASSAYNDGRMCPQTMAEVEKVKRAPLVVFQYPVYWFSVPAILKGWFDKVLVSDFAFNIFKGEVFDNGLLKGKRAILSLTTGTPEACYTDRGIHGDMNVILWPILYGTLRYCGFDVLEPQISFTPAMADDTKRKQLLESWKQRLLTLDQEKPVSFIPIENFDLGKTFSLKDSYIEEEKKNDTAPTVGQHLGKRLKSVTKTENTRVCVIL